MDVFSWFRQKRQGIRPAPFDDIRIPIEATPTFGLVVYCRVDPNERMPETDELLRYGSDWAEQHVADPLRTGIQEFLRQDLINLFVHDRAEMPEPPDDILRAYNPGETEERRFRNANRAFVIGSPDLLTTPRIGMWSVIAAARGIAAALPGGVIVDPEFPRLLPLEQLTEDLPLDGEIRIPEHILIPYHSDPRTGLLWITTKGMARFGLPDLEVRNAPPNLAASLMPVLNGLAQRLTLAAMRVVADCDNEDEVPENLTMRAQFRFTVADIRAAYDGGTPVRTPNDTDVTGSAVVRLEMAERERDGGEGGLGFVQLLPPHGVRGDIGVWLNRLLGELMGSDPQIETIETGDSAMESAHAEAVVELPRVRARFRAGFRSGEVLHVKHGFPTEDEGHEYMWIAVTTWEGDRIRGVIANDPQFRRDLRAGQAVEITESEVYDWMIAHSDGRVEGAYTNRALQDRSDDETKE